MINAPQSHAELPPQDEGGLRPPPGLSFWRRAWWWFDFIILVKLARLRFVAILLVIGIIITQWDHARLPITTNGRGRRPRRRQRVRRSSGSARCTPRSSATIPKTSARSASCRSRSGRRGRQRGGAAAGRHRHPCATQSLSRRAGGVGTWRVDYVPLSREIVAAGLVEFNERGQKTVSARVAGRIDKLLANETGQMVDEGDVLAHL